MIKKIIIAITIIGLLPSKNFSTKLELSQLLLGAATLTNNTALATLLLKQKVVINNKTISAMIIKELIKQKNISMIKLLLENSALNHTNNFNIPINNAIKNRDKEKIIVLLKVYEYYYSLNKNEPLFDNILFEKLFHRALQLSNSLYNEHEEENQSYKTYVDFLWKLSQMYKKSYPNNPLFTQKELNFFVFYSIYYHEPLKKIKQLFILGASPLVHEIIPWHINQAATDKNLAIMHVLIHFYNDIRTINQALKKPLYLYLHNTDHRYTICAINYGLNLNHSNNIGETFLYKAIKNSQWKLALFLLYHGADIAIKNNKQKSFLQLTQKMPCSFKLLFKNINNYLTMPFKNFIASYTKNDRYHVYARHILLTRNIEQQDSSYENIKTLLDNYPIKKCPPYFFHTITHKTINKLINDKIYSTKDFFTLACQYNTWHVKKLFKEKICATLHNQELIKTYKNAYLKADNMTQNNLKKNIKQYWTFFGCCTKGFSHQLPHEIQNLIFKYM